MVAALIYFRDKVLMTHRWQASGGASLGTFFIGQCLYQFANIYRSALRAELERIDQATTPMAELPEDWFDIIKGIEEKPRCQRHGCRRMALLSTDRARRALFMQEHGFSQREIADELSLPGRQERRKPHRLPAPSTPKEDIVTTIKHKHITALIDASSLGTRTARVARTSVTAAEGDALARRAAECAGRGKMAPKEFRGRADKRTYRTGIRLNTEGRKNERTKQWPKVITAARPPVATSRRPPRHVTPRPRSPNGAVTTAAEPITAAPSPESSCRPPLPPATPTPRLPNAVEHQPDLRGFPSTRRSEGKPRTTDV